MFPHLAIEKVSQGKNGKGDSLRAEGSVGGGGGGGELDIWGGFLRC